MQYHLRISQSKALKAVRGISMENVYAFRVIMDSGRSSNPSQNLIPEAVARIGNWDLDSPVKNVNNMLICK